MDIQYLLMNWDSLVLVNLDIVLTSSSPSFSSYENDLIYTCKGNVTTNLFVNHIYFGAKMDACILDYVQFYD